MTAQTYSLSELLRAIEAYMPAQSQADLQRDFLEKIKIGAATARQEETFPTKSAGAQNHVIQSIRKAIAKARSPRQALLLMNLQMRLAYSYETWMQVARTLLSADVRLYEYQATLHQLWVFRFTYMQRFSAFDAAKSGYWLRRLYTRLLEMAEAMVSAAGSTPYRPTAPLPGERQRILLSVTEAMPGEHPLLSQVLDIASSWREHFDADILVVNTSMPAQMPVSLVLDVTVGQTSDYLLNAKTIERHGESFAFAHNPHKLLQKNSFLWMADTLEAFQPHAVISLGPGNLLVDALTTGPRTMAIPNNKEVPLSAAQTLVVTEKPDTVTARLLSRAGVSPERIGSMPFAYRLPEVTGASDRSSFNFPADAFVFAIVGVRLQQDCTGAFLGALEQFAIDIPRAHFLFVGPVGSQHSFLGDRPTLQARARVLGFRSDVLALLQVCDAYLNPPRQGAGTSAAFALSAGLPIITLGDGDVAGVAGSDFCSATEDAYWRQAANLVTDDTLYASLSEAATARWAIASDTKARTQALVDLLEDADTVPLQRSA